MIAVTSAAAAAVVDGAAVCLGARSAATAAARAKTTLALEYMTATEWLHRVCNNYCCRGWWRWMQNVLMQSCVDPREQTFNS